MHEGSGEGILKLVDSRRSADGGKGDRVRPRGPAVLGVAKVADACAAELVVQDVQLLATLFRLCFGVGGLRRGSL